MGTSLHNARARDGESYRWHNTGGLAFEKALERYEQQHAMSSGDQLKDPENDQNSKEEFRRYGASKNQSNKDF